MSIDALNKDSNTNCTTPNVEPDNTPATGTSDDQNTDNNHESVDALDGQREAHDHKWADAINRVPTGVEDAGHDHNQRVALKSPVRIHLEPALVAQRRAHVNRVLMYKRRHERAQKRLPARLLTFTTAVFVVLVSLLSGGIGASYMYDQARLPLLDGSQHALFQTTRIYDRTGKLLYQLYDHQVGKGRRTYVNYQDVSPLLVNATVAAEDHTFWTNSGVDLYGIARAAVANYQSNGVVEGASTITQQLIKNQFFANQERTYQVKEQEAILAAGLTQQYPKWKIMEMYLNTVYYGDLNYGIEAAAQNYFRLQPQCSNGHCTSAVAQLTLGEASLLAGLPQGPTLYNPTINKQKALDRQKQVLQAMVDMQMITSQQMLDAQKEMQNFTFQPYDQKMQAPHFVWYVIDQLEQLLGAQKLETGGYNVYTTLDLDLQKQVEQIVYDHLYKAQHDSYMGYYGPLNITNNVNNAAAIVMNPINGEILAMDGSANYQDDTPTVQGQYNSALALRQPGSSFKPIVYATAFEMGWYPAMIIPDHRTVFPAMDGAAYYTPRNYDGRFHSNMPMTVRNAIANSFNIPAIDALEFAGIPNVVNMAQRLGVDVPQQDQVPPMALGAVDTSLLQMVGAYATFANKGLRVPPSAVLQINDNQGRLLYKLDEVHPHGTQVMRPDVAFLMSSILSDKKARYAEFGRGNPLELSNRPVAAKTGTTDSFRDNWTLGYTPYLTVGVWAGNSDYSTMNNVIGITGAGPIWHDVIEYASQYYRLPPDDFSQPADVHAGTVSALTGLLPHPWEPTVTDWFIDGTMPTIQGENYYEPPKPVVTPTPAPSATPEDASTPEATGMPGT